MMCVNVSKHGYTLLEFTFLPLGTQGAVSHLEEYNYFYTMREPQALEFTVVGYTHQCFHATHDLGTGYSTIYF